MSSSSRMSGFIAIDMSAQALYSKFGGGMEHIPVLHLRNAVCTRAVFSQRQLFERIVEFWTDHLNVFQLLGDVRLIAGDDRAVGQRDPHRRQGRFGYRLIRELGTTPEQVAETLDGLGAGDLGRNGFDPSVD